MGYFPVVEILCVLFHHNPPASKNWKLTHKRTAEILVYSLKHCHHSIWFPYYHHTPCHGLKAVTPNREAEGQMSLVKPEITHSNHASLPAVDLLVHRDNSARCCSQHATCLVLLRMSQQRQESMLISGTKTCQRCLKKTNQTKNIQKPHKHQNRSICPVAKRCTTTWSSATQGKLAQVGTARLLVILKGR